MPRINFKNVDDVKDFGPLPEGTYLCRLAEVEEAETRYGDPMWKLRLEVAAGPYLGRYIFENMPLSNAGLPRVKLICHCLGIDTSGEVDLTPAMLKGRTCQVAVEIEEYEDEKGRTKRRNVVPFNGYERTHDADAEAPDAVTADPADTKDAHAEDDIPF